MRFTDEEYARARQSNEDRDELQEAQEELARLRAEVEKLRSTSVRDTQSVADLSDALEFAIDERNKERAEVEKLRADVVWAVRHGGLVIPGSFTWVKDIDEVDDEDDEYRVGEASVDGTDASLLSAVRRAREQNNA